MPVPAAASTSNAAVPQAVWAWLMRLHALTAGASSAEEAEARVNLVAGMLTQRFPTEAFAQRSLEHVAAQSRFWPSYGELVERLQAWWRDNRPRTELRLAPPEAGWRGPTTDEERERIAGGFADLRAEMAARMADRESSLPAPPPLPDVALKGDRLDALRARRRTEGRV